MAVVGRAWAAAGVAMVTEEGVRRIVARIVLMKQPCKSPQPSRLQSTPASALARAHVLGWTCLWVCGPGRLWSRSGSGSRSAGLG